MEPGVNTGGDDLQKAIDEITNANKPAADANPMETTTAPTGGMTVVQPLGTAEVTQPVADTGAMPEVAPVTTAPQVMNDPTQAVSEPTPVEQQPEETPMPEQSNETNEDLASVKRAALVDLGPILDKVDMPAEDKFKMYREALEENTDGTIIAPAYNSAKLIGDDKERAEALLFIIQKIDGMA